MGIAKKSFEGIETNIPGVYSKSVFPPQGRGTGVASNIVAIIGSANGGVPYNASGVEDQEKINVLSSPSQALDLLAGGNAYYMSEFFLTPTKDPELNIPRMCYFFRVDPATQSSATLQDITPTDIIELKSARYGIEANKLARKIEAGTTSGYKATILFRGKKIAEKDNIFTEHMEIQYTGAGTAATMTIDATTLETTCTGASGDDISITLADYANLGEIVDYINSLANYNCSLKGSLDSAVDTFDAVTDQDIKTSAYTAVANIEALINFFNLQSGGEIEANLKSGAARDDIVVDTGYVYFTGGGNGSATSTDWADCLTLMEKFNINHILAATGDASIHALVDAHCIAMSAISGKKNRSWGAGAASSTSTKSDRIAEMKAINSARAEYNITPFNRYDMLDNGAKRTFDPFYGAALTAGIRFANGVTSYTDFQTVNALNVTEEYEPTDLEDYIDAGATIFTPGSSGVEVKNNLSTYQGTSAILNYPSALRTTDFITLDSQAKIMVRLAKLVKAPTSLQINELFNYLITNLLPSYVDDGYLTDDPNNGQAAFSDVSFNVIGDAFYFDFTGIVPLPLRYGFIKQKFTVIGQNL